MRNIGLLAGWGEFPMQVARALKQQGYRVFCLGIRQHASSELANICDDFRPVGIARLGAQIRYFRRCGVTHATMAGKIFKARLMFGQGGWFWYLPDWTCIRTFYPHFVARKRDRKDDTLLHDFVRAYARHGIVFAPATDFAPELLVKLGQLCGGRISSSLDKDIAFGWQLAKAIGGQDIGQSVVVKDQVCVAVEAMEGTDQCIARAGQLCPQGGFTVVKVAKPQQDMRFDVPTIGSGTIETMHRAGGRVLAVEAGKTIIVNEPETLALAERYGIAILALEDQAVARREAA